MMKYLNHSDACQNIIPLTRRHPWRPITSGVLPFDTLQALKTLFQSRVENDLWRCVAAAAGGGRGCGYAVMKKLALRAGILTGWNWIPLSRGGQFSPGAGRRRWNKISRVYRLNHTPETGVSTPPPLRPLLPSGSFLEFSTPFLYFQNISFVLRFEWKMGLWESNLWEKSNFKDAVLDEIARFEWTSGQE